MCARTAVGPGAALYWYPEDGQSIRLGLRTARAGRFDLLGRIASTPGRHLDDERRRAFGNAVRSRSDALLAKALAAYRRRTDTLFRDFAAPGGDPAVRVEAWSLVWRMLPGFPGSVADLLSTAGAVARV